MFISRNDYEKLVAHNKNLTRETTKLERENKELIRQSETFLGSAIRWRAMYDQMCELFDDRETKSPIVEQRDAEIEALKHMIERLETEQEKIRKENISLKKVVKGG